MLEFKTYNQLKSYTAHSQDRLQNGEVATVEEDNLTLMWNQGEWTKINAETDNNGLSMSVYELNQQIYNQLPAHSSEQIERDKKIIKEFIKDKKYLMLLGKNISYYTVFCIDENILSDPIEEAVIECAESVGPIKSCDDYEDSIEIWVDYQEGAECLYLFDYENGMVFCGR